MTMSVQTPNEVNKPKNDCQPLNEKTPRDPRSSSRSSSNSLDTPLRKSRRLHKEIMANDDELLANFNDGFGMLDRGSKIPIGLSRTPFEFKKKQDENMERQKNKLKIDMKPVFKELDYTLTSRQKTCSRKRGISGQLVESSNSEKDYTKTNTDGAIRVGSTFQAQIESEPSGDKYSDDNEEKIEYRDDHDELVWTPPKEENQYRKLNYDTCRNEYWRSIWRQFEGHIPMEVALHCLMSNDYSFEKSLDTIDQKLKYLPQAFKPLCKIQFERFHQLLEEQTIDRRELQELSMRNYHIGEVQRFYYKFRNHYYEKMHGSCNCKETLLEDLEFEPRWGCTNCTKHLRDTNLLSSKLCFICTTYQQITGRMRPAKAVVFKDDEVLKIENWKKMEKKEGRQITREEFEGMEEAETMSRWMRNELTDEEYSILEISDLSYRRRKSNITEEEKIEAGKKLVEQLTSYPIPQFKKCECQKYEDKPVSMTQKVRISDCTLLKMNAERIANTCMILREKVEKRKKKEQPQVKRRRRC